MDVPPCAAGEYLQSSKSLAAVAKLMALMPPGKGSRKACTFMVDFSSVRSEDKPRPACLTLPEPASRRRLRCCYAGCENVLYEKTNHLEHYLYAGGDAARRRRVRSNQPGAEASTQSCAQAAGDPGRQTLGQSGTESSTLTKFCAENGKREDQLRDRYECRGRPTRYSQPPIPGSRPQSVVARVQRRRGGQQDTDNRG